MRIDGRPNRRACMVPARDGLACERQNAFPSADVDLLAAADWLFPRGMDHHTLMTGSRAGNALFLKMVREMGGSGTLPDADAARRSRRPTTDEDALDACVIGGGPAGLRRRARDRRAPPGRARRRSTTSRPTPGGSLLAERGGGARARDAGRRGARRRRARWSRARPPSATFPEDVGAERRAAGVLAVATDDRPRARERAAHAVRDGLLRSEPALRRQRSSGRDRGARAAAAWRSAGASGPVAAERTRRHPGRGAHGRAAGA